MLQLVTSAFIVDQKVENFICGRRLAKGFAGYYATPGGQVEKGETPVACVYRELEEELGLLSKDLILPSALGHLTLLGHNYLEFASLEKPGTSVRAIYFVFHLAPGSTFYNREKDKTESWFMHPLRPDKYPLSPMTSYGIELVRDLLARGFVI